MPTTAKYSQAKIGQFKLSVKYVGITEYVIAETSAELGATGLTGLAVIGATDKILSITDSIVASDSILGHKTSSVSDTMLSVGKILSEKSLIVLDLTGSESESLRDKEFSLLDIIVYVSKPTVEKSLPLQDFIVSSEILQFQLSKVVMDSFQIAEEALRSQSMALYDTISALDLSKIVEATKTIVDTVFPSGIIKIEKNLVVAESIGSQEELLRNKIFTLLDACTFLEEITRDKVSILMDDLAFSDAALRGKELSLPDVVSISTTIQKDVSFSLIDQVDLSEVLALFKELSIAEEAILSDSISKIVGIEKTVTENIQLAEASLVKKTLQISEVSLLSEAILAEKTLLFTESITAIADFLLGKSLQLAETLSLEDLASLLGEYIWEDGFESGDFSAWSGTSETEGTIEVTTANPKRGQFNARSNITGTGTRKAYCYKSGFDEDLIYVRLYVQFHDTLPDTSGDELIVLYVRNKDDTAGLFQVGVQASTARWGGNYRKAGAWTGWSNSNYTASLDTWYCVEAAYYVHQTEGYFKVWIDGTLIFEDNNIDTSQEGNAGEVRVGVYKSVMEGDPSHSVDIDCVVVDDSYIGVLGEEVLLTDSIVLSELLLQSKSFILTEAIGLVSVITRGKEVFLHETVTLLDSVLKTVSFSLEDLIVLTEVAFRSKQFITQDSAQLIESILALKELLTTESLSLVDLVEAETEFFKTISDYLNVAEQVRLDKTFWIEDALYSLGNVLALKQFPLLDAISISDMVSLAFGILKTLSDSISLTEETFVSQLMKLVDTLSLSENLLVKTILVLEDSVFLFENLLRDRVFCLVDLASLRTSIKVNKVVRVSQTFTLVEVVFARPPHLHFYLPIKVKVKR